LIATVKVLALSARGQSTIAGAARRVVAYVEGRSPAKKSASPAAAYYAEGTTAPGHARGHGSPLAGLGAAGDPVVAEQLARLLTGAHARTGRPLLSASGSAGRLGRARQHLPPGRDSFTLPQAARIAGVDVSYLRRLARASATHASTSGAPASSAASVDRRERASLAATRDPGSGRWTVSRRELLRFLHHRQPPSVVIGYDVVCSVPKGVSVAHAFGDEDLRADIVASVNAGIDALVDYLERYAVRGMIDGRNRAGLGLSAASYQHDVSRADEAHLHVHTIVANALAVPLTDEHGQPERDRDGMAVVEWRALDGELFLQHVRTAGFVAAAAMRHELTRRRGVAWTPVRNGLADLDALPPSLLAAFSTRHGQVHEEFAELVAAGLFPDGRTEAAAQRRSRASKKVLADDEIRAHQQRILTDAGWTPAQVRALLPSRPHHPTAPTDDEIDDLVDAMVGPTGLTANSAVFTRRDVYQAVASWAVDRLDSAAISHVVDQVMTDQRIVLVEELDQRRRRTEQHYTAEDLLHAEDSLLALHRQGRVAHGGPPRLLLPPDTVPAALAAAQAAEGTNSIRLSDEQETLLRDLLTSTDLIRPVIGPAGSGKTTVMRVLTRILTTHGYTVLGAAHGGRQAEQLGDALDQPSRVVSGWITLLDNADDPTAHWPANRTVLIVDEATQVSTRDAERLARRATRTGTVVILVGDPAQLGSVGAGGWFTHLVDHQPTPALLTVRRQQGPAMRSVRAALDGLRSAIPARTMSALARLADDGHIRLFDDRETLLTTAATDWYTERASGGAAPMMAEHQRDVDALTVTARALLQADGTLTGPVLTAAGRDFQVGDEIITLTQAGHTLIPDGAPRRDYIRTGTIGRVTAVHAHPDRPDTQHLQVTFPGRGTVRIDWAYLTYAFPDGRDGGLAHAYALTAHKAQGSTMRTARPLLADDTSRAGLYVMLSRAQHDLRAYLIRRHDLDTGLDDEDWLPVLPDADATTRLAQRLRASRDERLAGDIDPHARAAHHLATTHTLPALIHLRRNPASDTPPSGLLRRAELAAEAALTAEALASPPAALIARIGPRPSHGPHRDQWDRAVTALAIYRAHVPNSPVDDPGPPPHDTPSDAWNVRRHEAREIALAWIARLAPTAREHFTGPTRTVPRDRALSGIHALLDAGWNTPQLLAHLTAEQRSTIRDAAAVLDHRVTALCREHAIDTTLYQLPPPRTLPDLWQNAIHLLDTAETAFLVTQPPADLTRELTALEGDLAIRSGQRDRARRLDSALTRQADLAMIHVRQSPAAYLTDLLGPVPSSSGQARSWYAHARRIEDYRLRILGLPYGQPAAPDSAPPSHRALGATPHHPDQHDTYRDLITPEGGLDLPL
jgi:conjugative relaxase-like TrwC/TraI family protein